MRGILAFGALLAAVAVSGRAANFSGKWAVQNPGGRGGSGAAVLALNHAGSEVTGTISIRIDMGTNSPVNNEIWAGKAEGDAISFYVWTGTDQPAKTIYRGTMSASGDEIVFTVTRGRGGSGQQLTARRVR